MKNSVSKIWVTGGSGFVGSRMILPGALPGQEIFCPSHEEVDITDEKSVMRYAENCRPEVIVHTAAVSRIDVCEKEKELSRKINVLGTVYMARAAKNVGAKLIFCSSDQVYGGSGGERPLKEDEKNLHPVNLYGWQKLEAEDKALDICPEAVGLRLTWMFDLPLRNRFTNSNLILNVLSSLVKNQPLKLCANDHRGMTYVREVTENIPAMIRAEGGIYNYGSQSFCSTYETFSQVFELFGAEKRIKDLLLPFWSESPRNLLMDTEKAKKAGAVFSDTRQGTEKMLREYGVL